MQLPIVLAGNMHASNRISACLTGSLMRSDFSNPHTRATSAYPATSCEPKPTEVHHVVSVSKELNPAKDAIHEQFPVPVRIQSAIEHINQRLT